MAIQFTTSCLVASHDCHERDLLEALRDGAEQKSDVVFELVFFDIRHATDFFVVFSLFDRLRSGLFSAVCRNVVTSASQPCSRPATTQNATGTTWNVQTLSFTAAQRWYSRTLKWKRVAALKKHSVTLLRCTASTGALVVP